MSLEFKNHALKSNLKEILESEEFNMKSDMLHTKYTLEIGDTHYIYENQDDRDSDSQIVAALKLTNDIYKNIDNDLDM